MQYTSKQLSLKVIFAIGLGNYYQFFHQKHIITSIDKLFSLFHLGVGVIKIEIMV